MLELQHPYIAVDVRGKASYGGGQQFSPDPMLRRCGCGVVAATDLLLYLSTWHPNGAAEYYEGLLGSEPIPFPAYVTCLSRMNRRYFPMIPHAGINGVMLMAGMERFFRDQNMPYTARWCFSADKLWARMEHMLREDFPVITSVGPNFPQIWGKKRVRFYIQSAPGQFIPAGGAKQHYFTVTGMDRDWLRISSWGRMYYLRRQEFEEYTHRDSLRFVSNILLVDKK